MCRRKTCKVDKVGKIRTMGLAASQSRFLLLTARQNSLSTQMMALTNQNMALQRQSAVLSEEYNRKLNAKYITYNDNKLDYNSIMASGSELLLTSSSGAVMLTPSKATSLGLGSAGTGKEFLSKYPTQTAFIKSFISDYGNYGTATKVDPYTGEESVRGSYNVSAYKYSDTIMNDAVVKVSAATVLGLGGYLQTDENGQQAEPVTMEYAMGTQESQINSLACIYTLDKYQCTESNVHAVVNEFVLSAVEQMSDIMEQNLGTSSVVEAAIEAAKQKTIETYQEQKINANQTDIATLYQKAREGNKQPIGTTAIMVSTADTIVTHTTGVSTEYYTDANGNHTGVKSQNIQTTQDVYDGKDILLDTAQLTATFLNYFDAAMCRAMGDDRSKAFADHIEAKTYMNGNASNVLESRERMRALKLVYIEDIGGAADNAQAGMFDEYGVSEGITYIQYGQADAYNSFNTTMGIYTGSYAGAQNSISVAPNQNLVTTRTNSPVSNSPYNYNYNVTITNNASVPMEIVWDTGVVKGYDAIGQYGDAARNIDAIDEGGWNTIDNVNGKTGAQKLLSETFTEGASGIYGTVHQKNDDYNSLVNGTSKSVGTANDTSQIDQYKKLYHAIATGGWKVDSKLNDTTYLNQQVLYGNMVINKFNGTKSWTTMQLGDSTTGLNTVDDKEAQEKAKKEYESQTAIMKTRQTFLENQIETLKTASDSIDTEKESLNSIMENEQEKFKVFVSA